MTRELAAATFDAFDRQRCIVPLQRMPHDRESQTRAAEVARAPGIDAVETFSEARNVLRRDADSSVAHADVPALVVGPPAQLDLAMRRRVLHGVGEQVGYDGVQLVLHALEPRVAVERKLYLARTLLDRQRFLAQQREHPRYVDGLFVERPLAGLQL